MFTSKKKPSATVGLDVEAGSIAATEVSPNGRVTRTAIGPLPPGVITEGDVTDPQGLSDALRALFSENKLSKNVRLGVANQRVVVRTMRLPLIEDKEELETAIRFQAQDQIPMPLDQAILDHQVVSRETGPDGQRQMDVVAVAARRDMVSILISAMRNAGLKPEGIDLSAFGMLRALEYSAENGNGNGAEPVGPDGEPVEQPAPLTTLFCHLGDVTNLAVARGTRCLFTRMSPYGLENIAAGVAADEDLELDEAREWLLEVGLEDPVDDFDDDLELARTVRDALSDGASKLVNEVRVSLEYYSAQEGAAPVERVVACGPGSTIPGLPERIQDGLGLAIDTQTPPALSRFDGEDAARLTVSYGLALGD